MDLPTYCADDERPIRPLGLNVGGVVDPDDLVGRSVELAKIDEALMSSEGAVLVGDRRMGKTSIIRKLEDDLRQRGHTVLRVSAQTTDPKVLANRIKTALVAVTWLKSELEKWTVDVDVSKAGVSLRRTSKKGDTTETGDLFEWVAKKSGSDQLIVIIDELAAFLASFDDQGDATEFMYSLRVVRQEHKNITIVVAGSIGLHHVLPAGKGLTNDLVSIGVAALQPCDAYFLARCLIDGTQLETADEELLAARIAQEADFIPYYVHYLVQQLLRLDAPATVDDVPVALDAAFSDPLDPLDFAHYRDRLADYYGMWAIVAGRCLDHYAMDGELSIDELSNRLTADDFEKRPTRDELTVLVEGLERDHYVQRLADGRNSFATNVLRRGWIALRRLG